jgi:molybdopterin-guanine dinucleotide biosynthesis protein A
MSETVSTRPPIPGVILAGGLARRMGGADKPLVELAGRPMLARVVERLRPQVDALIINANGDPLRYAHFGLPVVPDQVGDYAGPLAGVLAGMRWAEKNMPDARFIVSAAADTPFFPRDLVARLSEGCGRDEGTVSVAASPAGSHPVFALWPIAVADELERFLRAGETGKILTFADRYARLNVPFDDLHVDGEDVDPFFNVNTPEEAQRAERIAAALEGQGQ